MFDRAVPLRETTVKIAISIGVTSGAAAAGLDHTAVYAPDNNDRGHYKEQCCTVVLDAKRPHY